MMNMIGELRGMLTRQNGEYTFNYLVVEDSELQSHQVQLGRDQETKVFLDQVNALKGKIVSVPFYIRQFTGKAGKGFSLNFSNTGTLTEYKG